MKNASLLALAASAFFSLPLWAEPIHHVTSEVCGNCHKEIYQQWKGSMHANSTALKDPIHATFYKKVVGDPTKEGVKHKASGKYPVCLNCHAPNAARDKVTKLDANPAYSEGVNCVACHTLAKYNGIDAPDGKMRLGIKAYDLSEQIQGSQGFLTGAQKLAAANDPFGGAATAEADSKPNPHLGEAVTLDGKEIPALPMQTNPTLLKTTDACMGCHDKRNNPHGVALCQTGDEYKLSGSDVNCNACHMPVSNGFVNHDMGGGHDKAMLKRAVLFNIATEKAGDTLKTTVLMHNQQPHSLPTGAPFRNMYLKLMAYDASGNVVWENAEGHPGKDDPQAYMAYRLADDKGADAMPPVATQLGEDSRLKPHEKRTLTYDIPANDVVLVRGELYYNLLWPVLVEKFKHLPEDLKAPQLIAASEVSL
jgi:hypothetical protein